MVRINEPQGAAGKSIPGPEVGAGLVCLRNSNEARGQGRTVTAWDEIQGGGSERQGATKAMLEP